MAKWTFALPPVALKVNRRMGDHWASVAKAKRAYRAACDAAVAAVGPLGDERGVYPVHVTVTAVLGPRMRCDPSDLGSWAKDCIDALVAAGVLADDDASHINPFTARVDTSDRKHPRLEVTWQ